jgi:predicted RNase H-like HicB family nuclease
VYPVGAFKPAARIRIPSGALQSRWSERFQVVITGPGYHDSMTARRFQVEIEWDPDDEVWVTYVPALGHLSTYGETREEALAQTREAVTGYLEAAAINSLTVPAEHELDIVEIAVAAP